MRRDNSNKQKKFDDDEEYNNNDDNIWRNMLDLEFSQNMQLIMDAMRDSFITEQLVNEIEPKPLEFVRQSSTKVTFPVKDNGGLILDSLSAALNTNPDIPVMIVINAFKIVPTDNNTDVFAKRKFRIVYNRKEQFLDGNAAREASGNYDDEDAFWSYYNDSKSADFKVVPQGRFIESVELWVPTDLRERRRIGGSFIPYYVQENYANYLETFKRFDIYGNEGIVNNTNCFIVACQNSGLFNKSEITFIESQINDYYVNMTKLKPLCEKVGFAIRLRYRTKHDQIVFVNKENKRVLRLYLIKIDSFNHYILDERVNVRCDPFNRIMDSNEFVYESIEKGILKKFHAEEIAKKRFGVIEKFEIEVPTDPFLYSKIITFEEKKDKKEVKLYFADLECIVSEDKHIPFCAIIKKEDGEISEFYGERCEKKMLDYLFKESKKCKPITYFHNLSYDGVFLAKYGIIGSVEKENRIYQEVIKYGSSFLTFRDSYSLIPTALRNFASMFNLGCDNEKEVYPYQHINKENMYECSLNGVGENETPKWDEKTKNQFIENCNKLGIIEDNQWNVEVYTKYYCRRDVEILYTGFLKFVEMCKEELKLDPTKFLSLSSMAYNYFKREAYDGENINEYTGTVREYLRKGVYGGRCMVKNNKMTIVEDKVVDFDACSLYPSAMSRLYLPTGEPKKLEVNNNTKSWLLNNTMAENDIDSNEKIISCYVVTIIIRKVNKILDFPLIVKKMNGVNYNVNESNVMMTVDNIYLEDLIKYQRIEFDIIDGMYWTGRKSVKLSEAIKKVYDLRSHYKREKNPLQNIYKLLMNSSYGKTIQKAALKEITYKREGKELETYWFNNYSNIIKSEQIYDSDIYRVETRATIDEDYTPIIIGVLILSMSKRIMNELFDCAEKSNIDIFYQDTDSIHLKMNDLPNLVKKYEESFDRKLIGTEMCQFHSDFPPITNNSKDVYSKRSLFLAKKAYIDCLVDQNGEEKSLVRMKGVPEINVIMKAINYGGEWEMYKKLYCGYIIEFDLIEYGVHFKIHKSMQIESLRCFKRRVKFTNKMTSDELIKKLEEALRTETYYDMYKEIRCPKCVIDKIELLKLNLNETNFKSTFNKIIFLCECCSSYAIRVVTAKSLIKSKNNDIVAMGCKMLFLAANDMTNVFNSNVAVTTDIRKLFDQTGSKGEYDIQAIGDWYEDAWHDIESGKESVEFGVEVPNELAKSVIL